VLRNKLVGLGKAELKTGKLRKKGGKELNKKVRNVSSGY